MKSRHLSLLAVAVAAVVSGVAQADTFVLLKDVTALWYDGTPTGNVTYLNNPSTAPKARWGTGGQQSGYDYVVANQPIQFTMPPTPSNVGVLGTFTHQNYPINAGSSITSNKLRIIADVYVDPDGIGSSPEVQVGDNLAFNYGFDHWETGNADRPCADGGTVGVGVNEFGCADRVIAHWLSNSQDFLIGTDIYTLNVLGFSLNTDGTSPFASFWTAETLRNNAYLVGNVDLRKNVQPDPIPEPATLALLGLGLAGLGFSRRKQ